MDWDWIVRNADDIETLTKAHVFLALVPVALGTAIAVPIGVACAHWRRLYPFILLASSALFAIPSVAFFVFMLPYTGLTQATAIVPLTLYTASMLVRNVVDGINATDESVRQAATAMGYRGLRRIATVELPIALPVVLGGLRVATVANIGMVAVTSVIGIASLGDLFIDGTQRFFLTPIIVGIVLTFGLAIVADLFLVILQRRLTPWARRTGASS